MIRERKAYTKEFKLMSVELSNTRTDLTALAKELDIAPNLLYRWRKEVLYQEKWQLSRKRKGDFDRSRARVSQIEERIV